MKNPELSIAVDSANNLLDENGVQVHLSTLPLTTATFLENYFNHVPKTVTWSLRLRTSSASESECAALQAAIHSYYEDKLLHLGAEWSTYWRNTLLAFVYGGLFLALCLGLRHVLETMLAERLSRIFDEGLIILGWVALWRPAEMLAYNWQPLVRQLRVYRRLARLSVTLDTRHDYKAY